VSSSASTPSEQRDEQDRGDRSGHADSRSVGRRGGGSRSGLWLDRDRDRADFSNVLALSKTHHAAFDRKLFTIDQDYRLRVNPAFETESDVLQRTIIDREGEKISISEESLKPRYVVQHNATLE
jgi:hypothetical protein